MTASAKLTSKGQMTLPKEVRDELHLQPGDKIDLVFENGRYFLQPRNRSALDLFGALKTTGHKALSIEEMDEGIGRAVMERDRQSRDRS